MDSPVEELNSVVSPRQWNQVANKEGYRVVVMYPRRPMKWQTMNQRGHLPRTLPEAQCCLPDESNQEEGYRDGWQEIDELASNTD